MKPLEDFTAGFNRSLADLSDAAFWAARSLEHMSEVLSSPQMQEIFDLYEAEELYARAGRPYGKSRRGFKKWLKGRSHGILHEETITDILDADILD